MSRLTLSELESHLWDAANLLRGSIDSGDFKHYIFGLLFYKRICDVWREEYDARLEEFESAEMAAHPDEHCYHIPEGCFWEDVRKRSKDIGTALNTSFRAIEDANPQLQGVFQDVDFANQQRFPDDLLERLLQHFETHRMRRSDVDSRVLGDAYEYLIAKFADDAGIKGGEFFTPKEVVRLMVEILAPEEGIRVYDPLESHTAAPPTASPISATICSVTVPPTNLLPPDDQGLQRGTMANSQQFSNGN